MAQAGARHARDQALKGTRDGENPCTKVAARHVLRLASARRALVLEVTR
jgi:hypothetical protein